MDSPSPASRSMLSAAGLSETWSGGPAGRTGRLLAPALSTKKRSQSLTPPLRIRGIDARMGMAIVTVLGSWRKDGR
jgi:hypothetical protein